MAQEPIVLNLNSTDKDVYGKFIAQVRERARDPNRYSHGKPVLPVPPQNRLQAELFGIKLQHGEYIVEAKIRRYDLYLIGFKRPNGQWLEFERKLEGGKKDLRHIIDGSDFLPFGGNYDALGLSNLSSVGYYELVAAIKSLAESTATNVSRYSLCMVIVMVCESVRLLKLSKELTEAMASQKNISFVAWMDVLVHGWGDLSDRLLRADQKPDTYYFRLPEDSKPRTNKDLKIITASDAANVLALLLGNFFPANSLLLSKAAAVVGAINNNNNSIQGKGQPLVEVFSVRINSRTSGSTSSDYQLYGTIQVADGLGTLDLYNRGQADPEPIHPNDTASLTGPNRAISLCGSFTLSLDLNDKDKNNEVVSKGIFSWDIFLLGTSDTCYDKRLSETVNGKYGSATVYYAMFRTAVQAKVDILLISGDHGNDDVSVYGSIVARYSNYDYSTADQKKYYQTWLFNKLSNKPVSVRPGNPIPLSRSIVAVPTSSASTNLIVEAGLSDDKYAKGTAVFSPQIDGSSVQEIKGKSGSVRVTVTWSQVSQ